MTLYCPNCHTQHKVAGFYFSQSIIQGESKPHICQCTECGHNWEPKEEGTPLAKE